MTISLFISRGEQIDRSEKVAGHIGFGAILIVEKPISIVDKGT
jgi:hypothetical protein